MFKKIHILLLMPLLFLQGCIKDEALEMEADIVAVHDVEDSFLMNPVVTNNKVVVYVKPGERDLSSYSLKFDLTKGASILPDPESKRDYTQEVVFNVTSEDGQYKKEYSIKVIELANAIPTEFGFENYDFHPQANFTRFYDLIDGERFDNWDSGNEGVMIVAGENPKPEGYPTTFTTNAHSGKSAVLMKTHDVGPIGTLVGAPLAAGNFFLGTFNLTLPTVKSTHFGLPFNRMPESFEGFYKYKAGGQVLKPNPDYSMWDPKSGDHLIPHTDIKEDLCEIYAVLYRRSDVTADGEKDNAGKIIDWLDGATILTDDGWHHSVAAVARLEDGRTTTGEDFAYFKVPFNYIKNVKAEDVYALEYNLAIVMTSSKYGNKFIGALESTLIVDDIKINTK